MEYSSYTIIYRRYASLYVILGVSSDENELSMLEFIHHIIETYDRYFENVCELDLMFGIEKAHMILDEMIMDGQIAETNRNRVLAPIGILDKPSSGNK
jgi:hypothetical protein